MDHELSEAARMDAERLLQELRSGRRILVVDVRRSAEFAAGRIPGSRLIPLYQLAARASELASRSAEPVVIVSQTGARATLAAGALRIKGFDDVFVLEGGIVRWSELGFPIETAGPASVPPPTSG